MFSRSISINLPGGQSAFLWGARKIGKSTLLKTLYKDSLWFDFLDTHLFIEALKAPWIIRERVLDAIHKNQLLGQTPIILDEVQKIPMLLDEVHWMIENKNLSFILCGSSARKLKRNHANLLGGRAWRYELLPLLYNEIPDFNLLRALNNGLIPPHYTSDNPRMMHQAYIDDYLKEEIQAEGLSRNLMAFARFTDLLGFCNGELINFTSISRDCGVNVRTVQEYFSIVSDTLLGTLIEPFYRRRKRTILSTTPKFYLLDPGLANYLAKKTIEEERGPDFGRSFEHFIFCELRAHSSYSRANYSIRFWRTVSGQEVDFVLGDGEVAIEVKSGKGLVDSSNLKHLIKFIDEYKPKKTIVVTNELHTRKREDGIELFPWRIFLESLWNGEIIS